MLRLHPAWFYSYAKPDDAKGGSTREKAGTATTVAAGDAMATTTDVIGADKARA
jgi:hypothetical protein